MKEHDIIDLNYAGHARFAQDFQTRLLPTVREDFPPQESGASSHFPFSGMASFRKRINASPVMASTHVTSSLTERYAGVLVESESPPHFPKAATICLPESVISIARLGETSCYGFLLSLNAPGCAVGEISFSQDNIGHFRQDVYVACLLPPVEPRSILCIPGAGLSQEAQNKFLAATCALTFITGLFWKADTDGFGRVVTRAPSAKQGSDFMAPLASRTLCTWEEPPPL